MRLAILLLLASCTAETLDVRVTDRYWDQDDPAIAAEWKLFETSGETAGHGDTIRRIYANSFARFARGDVVFFDGSVLVKEVYANEGGTPGALQVIETMHRVGTLRADQDDIWGERLGWVFGATSTRGGAETDRSDFCWRRCHVNAPYAGAWFDYATWQ